MTAPETAAVLSALAAGGAEARFVGGCVRDAWLGRPFQDIDIATDAAPERVMDLLTAAGLKAVPTGIDHGTVTAVSGGKPFEITTLRRDVETDGRHAVVAFTADWREDAARRDFTFNALSAEPDGTLHDYFGGLSDLAAGRVRFVGEARTRIAEDVLRALRFFRFHAHYGTGAPDAEGLAACAAAAPLLPGLSGERVRAEILRLLQAPDPVPVWRTMADAGVLAPLLPEADDRPRLERLVALDRALGDPSSPLLRLAALLPGDRIVAEAVADRLKLSNAERTGLAAYAAPPVVLGAALPRAARRVALHRLDDGALAAGLLRLDAATRGDVPAAVVAEALAALPADTPPPFPLAGRDLLALGLAPGPAVGAVLKVVEEWWIGGGFEAGRADCLAEAGQRIKNVANPLTSRDTDV
jgi:poly(A) polymerase